ncbi:MAG: lipoprotein [Thermodesulfovibrionales bacterium]
MMKRIISLLTLIVFATSMAGCASMEEHKGATTGAAIGAGTGAVAGALMGHKGAKTETAIIGGLVGALVGGLIGHYAYDVKRDRQETARQYNYQSSTRTLVRIEEVSVTPSYIMPGDEIQLKATYAVLAPADNADISIKETREIFYRDELLGKPEITVVRRGGTYVSNVPLTLPRNAKRGAYKLVTTVQAGNELDSRESTFFVE